MLDSHAEKSNMGSVPIDSHVSGDFQKGGYGFLAWYLSCFRPWCFHAVVSLKNGAVFPPSVAPPL